MNRIQELYTLGQSVWLDYIERGMIESGELASLVDEGVAGVTSNPTIFQQAIAKSDKYATALQKLAASDLDNKALFESLAIADIQAAADVLLPVYERAGGHDGFVSLEVAPDLAHDAAATVAEAKRLHSAVNKRNLLIKVPATVEGVEAIRQLIAAGISINVTLIFGLERYAAVKRAYLEGLEERAAAGKPVDKIASVASFFVSRVDGNIDPKLEAIATSQPDKADAVLALRGKAAVANAKLAYRQFEAFFAGPRWEALVAKGARVQRPLWASTSSKNPAYSDLIYVEPLMGNFTVNTMPPNTLAALRDHGAIADTVRDGVDEAAAQVAALEELGITLGAVADELEADGVKKFIASFDELLKTIDERRKEMAAA